MHAATSEAGAHERRDLNQIRDSGNADGRKHAAALQLRVLVLRHQHRTHQAGDSGYIGEDANHPRALRRSATSS